VAVLWFMWLVTGLTTEAQFCAQVSPRGICDGQSGTVSEFFGFPFQYHATMALHTYI
jgi:hypothetical protein